MPRAVLFLLAVAAVLHAQNLRLYLKDGTYHIVREYKVESDRVRFYSVERSDWEEIPLELADLKKTEAQISKAQEETRQRQEADRAEDAFERAQRREIAAIPTEAGLYWFEAGALKSLPIAESKVVNNKRRAVLKAITPLPVLTGKATVEVDGENSKNVLGEARPTFYFRLAEEERFALLRLKPAKGARVVEQWDIIPLTKEIVVQRDSVDLFRQQMLPGLYKIWPTEPLPPGEYAVVEFTEGKGNTQVWDFAIRR
jgi:hypothetical protein